jgi:integrase
VAKKKMNSRYQRSKVPHLYLDRQYGVYYARARNAKGRDVWQSLSTKSFTVAKEIVLTRVAEIQAGSKRSSAVRGIAMFQEAADIYCGRVKADSRLKKRSIRYRLETVTGLFRSWPELHQLTLRSITADDCLRWAGKYKEQVHGTWFNNTVDTLRHIFAIAKESGIITTNPAAAISKAKVALKKLELPSREQFHQILATIGSTGAGYAQDSMHLVEFLAYSGCRITEAAHIRWADVEWRNADRRTGVIRIHGHEVDGTKNRESRSVPILEPMRDLLDRIAARNHAPRSPDRRGKGFVLTVTECRRALTSACRKVGAKHISHHDLRHLFATRSIEAGVDIPTVSRWLGHKDGGALAMRVYGHLRDEHSQAMAAKVRF